jgi:hypothetical protein
MNERERALALLGDLKTLICSPVWETLGAEEKGDIIARLIGAVEVTRSKIPHNVETMFIQQCFSFTRKGNPAAGPVSLQRIDHEMRDHFGVSLDAERYFYQWVDTIGLMLAAGKTFDAIIGECKEAMADYPQNAAYHEIKLRIAEYLDNNFVFDASIGEPAISVD